MSPKLQELRMRAGAKVQAAPAPRLSPHSKALPSRTHGTAHCGARAIFCTCSTHQRVGGAGLVAAQQAVLNVVAGPARPACQRKG